MKMKDISAPLLAVLLLTTFGCGRGKQEEQAKSQEPPEVVLGPEDATVVVRRTVSSGPTLSGTLTARVQATVRAQLAGSVLETYAEPGETVRRGQVLARLDTAALRDSQAGAQAAVTNARNSLAVAQREAERQRILAAAGAVAERNIETSAQQVVAARAALAQARALLASAQEQLGNARVTAPFSGVVSDKPVSSGDVVQPGTALYSLVDPSSLELEAAVPAERLSALQVGAPVVFNVNGYPGRTFRGRISRLNPIADPATRQVRVYAEVPNEGDLVSGLFAEGRVASQSTIGLTVPDSAIDRRMAKPAVLRVRDGRVERVQVQLGLIDEEAERVEIRQGVREGDVVLKGAAQEIPPGTRVRVAPAVRQEAERLAAQL
jgi:membrane fusion protein, multidrug efflux system